MAFNNKTSTKARTPSKGGPRPVAKKRAKSSVFTRARNIDSFLTKTQFRNRIARHRIGLRNEIEVEFRQSQSVAARITGLLS